MIIAVAKGSYQIEIHDGNSFRTVDRYAWTGGDKPNFDLNLNFSKEEFEAVKEFYYKEQIKEANFNGQLTEHEVLAYWDCAGTTPEERKQIFLNRAELDAWRTLKG